MQPSTTCVRVLTRAEPPHVAAQRTARPGEVRPPMADALHACAAACHAPRCFRQVELVMPLKLQQLSATRARDGRSVEWPVCVLWRTSAHAPWRLPEVIVSWLLSRAVAQMHRTRPVLTTADHAEVVPLDPGLICGLKSAVRGDSHGHVRFSRTVHVTVHGCEGVL